MVIDWLQANWLGLLTLGLVGFGAITSWRILQRSKRDLRPKVYLVHEHGGFREEITIAQEGTEADPFPVQLAAVNLGGSKLKGARLTVTIPSSLEVVDSPEWKGDTPNALIPNGSAIAWDLPSVGRNERVDPPLLTLHDAGLQRPAGSHRCTYTLRWEVWSEEEDLGSDDLNVRFKLNPDSAK